MSVEILATTEQNSRARDEMRRRGISFAPPRLSKLLNKARITKPVEIGDAKKSWDVLRTVAFIEQHLEKNDPILDLGAYASEVLYSLDKLGYSRLTGIDLNPKLSMMPGRDRIHYVTGDFANTSFPAQFFGAVTAISVIEHGFNAAKLFSEVSRVLKPGGYFIGSTDYWPDKIATNGITAFGLDWTIFSKAELLAVIEQARQYSLEPVGPLNFDANDRTVSWMDRHYTFAWFAVRKIKPTTR